MSPMHKDKHLGTARSFAFKANFALLPRNDFHSMAGLLSENALAFLRESVTVTVSGQPITMTRWSKLTLETLTALKESSSMTMVSAKTVTPRAPKLTAATLDAQLGYDRVKAAPTVFQWLEGVIAEAGDDPIHQGNDEFAIRDTISLDESLAATSITVDIDPFESMASLGGRFDAYRRGSRVEQAPIFEVRTLGRVPFNEIQEKALRVFDTMHSNFVVNIETCGPLSPPAKKK